jgi:hypothetical protein
MRKLIDFAITHESGEVETCGDKLSKFAALVGEMHFADS